MANKETEDPRIWQRRFDCPPLNWLIDSVPVLRGWIWQPPKLPETPNLPVDEPESK